MTLFSLCVESDNNSVTHVLNIQFNTAHVLALVNASQLKPFIVYSLSVCGLTRTTNSLKGVHELSLVKFNDPLTVDN